MKIAILGVDLSEKKGTQLPGHTVCGVFDPDQSRAQKLASLLKTTAFKSEDDLLAKSLADIVIVAPTNKNWLRFQ